MDDCSAPAGRGSYLTSCRRQACRFGLAVAIGLAAILVAPASAETVPRRLEPVAGTTKPAFSLAALDGSRHALAQHAGRVVLVHFFATWCEPCRAELASLSMLIKESRGEPPHILALNVAEVPARVQRFVESMPLAFPVLLDGDRAVTKSWGVSVLPTTFVLDRELVPRFLVEGDLDWTHPDVLAALDQIKASPSN